MLIDATIPILIFLYRHSHHPNVHDAIKYSAIKSVDILSNDIDIVVIAVAVFADLQQDGLQNL